MATLLSQSVYAYLHCARCGELR